MKNKCAFCKIRPPILKTWTFYIITKYLPDTNQVEGTWVENPSVCVDCYKKCANTTHIN